MPMGLPRAIPSRFLMALLSCAFLAACRKEQRPGSVRRPPAELSSLGDVRIPAGVTPEQRRLLIALQKATEGDAQAEERERRDRAELVEGAPQGFAPTVAGSSLTLRLTAVDPMVRAGKNPIYRLSIINAGSETIRLVDIPWSFLKRGDMMGWESFFKIHIKSPDGVEVIVDRPLLRSMTSTANGAAEGLSVRLLPGETLTARGWSVTGYTSDFKRELNCDVSFDKPGTYRMRVSVDAAIIAKTGRIDSNSVDFEIVP